MPFRSQAQRRLMYARHPDIAKRWRREYGPQKGLPERTTKAKPKRKGRRGGDRRQRLIEQFLAKR